MATNAENATEVFKRFIGKPDEPGEWFQITQERINQFADCTVDHQFIHVDPERSAQMSPFKVTVAHGFLTLSMLTHLSESVPTVYGEAYNGIMMGVNYGFDKVRFVSPVKVNARAVSSAPPLFSSAPLTTLRPSARSVGHAAHHLRSECGAGRGRLAFAR